MLLPFTSTLEADIAGRYEKYPDYGTNFAPKIALRWHPIDSLTLRGSVGRGFVAPILDVVPQETELSAAPVVDAATCPFYGPPDVDLFDPAGGHQATAHRETADGLGAAETHQD